MEEATVTKRNVLIALEWVPTYRTRFFELLKDALAESGIALSLIHGQPPTNKSKRGTDTSVNWATRRDNRRFTVGGTEFCWQPVLREVRTADLVIVQQESSLILNALLATGLARSERWALWGHGANFNPQDRSSTGERLKAWQTRRTDWFFAYTELSAAVAVEMGMDPTRITTVNNSVDGVQVGGLPDPEIARLVDEVTSRSPEICWVSSSLDRWKRLDFLCEAAEELKALRPRFELFVVGGGEGRSLLDAFAKTRPWVHVVGPQFGANKRVIGSAAKLMLHPGLVGLHVVEAFQFGTPMITTDIDYHSHEISYLQPGADGVVLPRDSSPADFADAVASLLADDVRRDELARNGKVKAKSITVEAMAAEFANGIQFALTS